MRCNHQVLFFSLIALPTPAFDRGVKAPPGARNEEGRELLPRRRLETLLLRERSNRSPSLTSIGILGQPHLSL